jgi:hypothetical protein
MMRVGCCELKASVVCDVAASVPVATGGSE